MPPIFFVIKLTSRGIIGIHKKPLFLGFLHYNVYYFPFFKTWKKGIIGIIRKTGAKNGTVAIRFLFANDRQQAMFHNRNQVRVILRSAQIKIRLR